MVSRGSEQDGGLIVFHHLSDEIYESPELLLRSEGAKMNKARGRYIMVPAKTSPGSIRRDHPRCTPGWKYSWQSGSSPLQYVLPALFARESSLLILK